MSSVTLQEMFSRKVAVAELLFILVESKNDDETINQCCSAFYRQYLEEGENEIVNAIHILLFGLTIKDPIRSGYVANLIGCFFEEGIKAEFAVLPILGWFEERVNDSERLFDRVCERLPEAEYSKLENFEAERKKLSEVFYVENRSWDALAKFYAVATSILIIFPNYRPEYKRLNVKLEKIRRYIPKLQFIIDLTLLDFMTDYIIIEPDTKRGLHCKISNIETNFQLAAILDYYYTQIYQLPQTVSHELIEFCLAPTPKYYYLDADNIDNHYKPQFIFYKWQALTEARLLPPPNNLDLWIKAGIYLEQKPPDITRFGQYKILLIQRPQFTQTVLGFGRNYASLPVDFEIAGVLPESAVDKWLDLFYVLAHTNGLYTDNRDFLDSKAHEVMRKRIAALPINSFTAFMSKCLRRFAPLVISNWGNMSQEDLHTLFSALNVLEAHHVSEGISLNEIDIRVDGLYSKFEKSSKVGYCNQIIFHIYLGIRYIIQIAKEGIAKSDWKYLVTPVIFRIFREAEIKAGFQDMPLGPDKFTPALLFDLEYLENMHGKFVGPGSSEANLPNSDMPESFFNSIFWTDKPPYWWPLISEFPMHDKYEYDIAVSFAGEDRSVVKELVERLLSSGCRVFYDEYEQSKLLGKNLVDHLFRVYNEMALYTLIIVSEHYNRKVWTKIERQAAQERALYQDEEYLLPIILDDTRIPGLARTTGYLDLRKMDIDQVCSIISDKLRAKFIQSGKQI